MIRQFQAFMVEDQFVTIADVKEISGHTDTMPFLAFYSLYMHNLRGLHRRCR